MSTLEILKQRIEEEKAAIQQLKEANQVLAQLEAEKKELEEINEANRLYEELVQERLVLERNVAPVDSKLAHATFDDVESELAKKSEEVVDDVVYELLPPVTYNGRNIFDTPRSAMIDGEKWFVGSDVAKILGFRNASDAVTKYVSVNKRVSTRLLDGKLRKLRFISVDGVGELVNRGKAEFAEEYSRWLGSVIDRVETTDDHEQIDTLKQELETLRERLAILDSFQDDSDTVNISVIASRYKLSARELNLLLSQSGVQRYDKSARCWRVTPGHEAYAKLVLTLDAGGVKSYSLRWTLAGEVFIDEVLKRDHGFRGFDVLKHNTPLDEE